QRGGEMAFEGVHDLRRLGLLALGYAEVHHAQAARDETVRQGGEVAFGDGSVGDHERALGARERRDELVRVPKHARPDADLVGPPGHRNAHALHRRSSFSIAAATSSTGPLASTTWAANSW